MSTRHIYSFLIATFFWTVCMSVFNYNDLTWIRCLIYFVGGLLFGLGMTLWQVRQERQYVRWSFAFDEIDIDGDVLQKDWMSHFRGQGFITVSGFGLLLKDRLIFVEQKRRELVKRFTIQFSEIDDITEEKIFGILKITLKSGKKELFKLDKKSDFYKGLMKLMEYKIK